MILKFATSLFQKQFSLLIFGIFLVSFFTVSCTKRGAQFPANKVHIIDSTDIKLQKYNKEITQRGDSAIASFISKQTENFIRTKSGIWYYIEKQTGLQHVYTDSIITFSYKSFTLEGTPVSQEENRKIKFGKKEIITGLEEGLKLMKKGESARFIIPWYLAYGAQGTDEIQPYTSMIFEVEVHK